MESSDWCQFTIWCICIFGSIFVWYLNWRENSLASVTIDYEMSFTLFETVCFRRWISSIETCDLNIWTVRMKREIYEWNHVQRVESYWRCAGVLIASLLEYCWNSSWSLELSMLASVCRRLCEQLSCLDGQNWPALTHLAHVSVGSSIIFRHKQHLYEQDGPLRLVLCVALATFLKW